MASPPIQQTIDFDQPCTSCGYNLRGLPHGGRCPECGAEVETSLRGDMLRFANPDWLRSVLQGANLMYYSILLGILAGFAVGLLSALAGSFGTTLSQLLTIVGALLQAFAIWLMTTQEPRVSFTERQITWRRVLRFCAVANLVSITLTQSGVLSWIAALGGILMTTAQVAQAVTGVIATYGYFAYAEGFAHRIPDARLARSTRIVKWGLAVVGTLTFVGIVILAAVGSSMLAAAGATGITATPAPSVSASGSAAPASSPTPPAITLAPISGRAATMVTAALFGCGVGVAYLVFGIWALMLLSRYRKALRLAISQSAAVV